MVNTWHDSGIPASQSYLDFSGAAALIRLVLNGGSYPWFRAIGPEVGGARLQKGNGGNESTPAEWDFIMRDR